MAEAVRHDGHERPGAQPGLEHHGKAGVQQTISPSGEGGPERIRHADEEAILV